jgi:hypothetical protein
MEIEIEIELEGGAHGAANTRQLGFNARPVAQVVAIRAAALAFANVVNENAPDSPDKSAAIRMIRDAAMTANAAIACQGR